MKILFFFIFILTYLIILHILHFIILFLISAVGLFINFCFVDCILLNKKKGLSILDASLCVFTLDESTVKLRNRKQFENDHAIK